MKVYFMTLLLYLQCISLSKTWIIPIDRTSQIYFYNTNRAFSYGYTIDPNQILDSSKQSGNSNSQEYLRQAAEITPRQENKTTSDVTEIHERRLEIGKEYNNQKTAAPISEADDLNRQEPEENNFDGSYSFSYHTDNSFRQESSDASNNVKGRYFYTDASGFHDLSYVAGSESGFLPTGGSLAKPNGVENSGPVTFYKVPFESPDRNDSSYSFEYSAPDHSRQEIGDRNGNIYGHYSFVNEAGSHDLRYAAGRSTGFLPLGGSLIKMKSLISYGKSSEGNEQDYTVNTKNISSNSNFKTNNNVPNVTVFTNDGNKTEMEFKKNYPKSIDSSVISFPLIRIISKNPLGLYQRQPNTPQSYQSAVVNNPEVNGYTVQYK